MDPTYFYSGGGTAGTSRKYYRQDPGATEAIEIDPVNNPLGNLSAMGEGLIQQGKIKTLPSGLITLPIGSTINRGSSSFTNTPGASNAPAGGAPAGTTPANTSTPAGSGDALSLIQQGLNPSGQGTQYVDRNSPEIKQFSDQQQAALDAQKAADLAKYDQMEKVELAEKEQQNANTLGMVKNKLAELGILDESTSSIQYLKDAEDDANEILNQTKAKYQIMRMDLDAKVKQAMIDAVDKQIEAVNKKVKDRIDQLQKGAEIGAGIYKTLTEAEIKTKEQQLEREKLTVQDAYNKGRLTIDAYNAELKRIDNEKDSLLKARELDIKSYQAETNRMKLGSGTSRVPYDQWLSQQEQENGMSINGNDPRWRAKYYQENPVTLKDLQKNLNTEQASRREIVQDMIDKGEIGLEQAMMIHPDIAPLFRRRGASALEKMFADLSTFSSSEENSDDGGILGTSIFGGGEQSPAESKPAGE